MKPRLRIRSESPRQRPDRGGGSPPSWTGSAGNMKRAARVATVAAVIVQKSTRSGVARLSKAPTARLLSTKATEPMPRAKG